MEPRTSSSAFVHLDPNEWEFHVRRADGTWLSRPKAAPGAPAGNTDPWTRRIPDSWAFDSAHEARDAAASHGAEAGEYSVIPAPRRPGEWLARGRTAA